MSLGPDVVDLAIDPRDRFVFAENVCDVTLARGNYLAVLIRRLTVGKF